MPVHNTRKSMTLAGILEAHIQGTSSIAPGPMRGIIDSLCEYILFDYVVTAVMRGCYCLIKN